MRTAFTELFGVQYPIVQGGMHHVGDAVLAAAVSNAGGLGFITALSCPGPEALREEIRLCRRLTAKPFGVNVTLLPAVCPPDYPALFRVIAEEKVGIVETAGNSPREWMAFLKENGILVLHKCVTVRHAKAAERIGCDAISMDGFECAGHPGEEDVANLVLLQQAARELTVPFIASGGMVDGRSLVAALALGASGMNMGTRFLATQDAQVHPAVKEAVLRGTVSDTRLIMRPLRNTARVHANPAAEQVLQKERELGDRLRFEDIAPEVAGVYPRVMKEGRIDSGAWAVGQTMGLIDDLPTVEALIGRIIRQAREISRETLARFVEI